MRKPSWLLNLAFSVIVAAAFAILFIVISDNRKTSDNNNTYIRFVACNLSTPPALRTQTTINNCWAEVEKDSGNKVKHYHSYDDYKKTPTKP